MSMQSEGERKSGKRSFLRCRPWLPHHSKGGSETNPPFWEGQPLSPVTAPAQNLKEVQMVLSTEENSGQGHLLPGANNGRLLISWSHSSEGMLLVTGPSELPFLGPACFSTPSEHPTLLCYTRHFRFWQLLHLPEGPASVLSNSSQSSLAGLAHLGQPWLRGVPTSAEEILSRLNILPCIDTHPPFWPPSLWLEFLSCLLFLTEIEHELFSSAWVGHRTHLGIIPTQLHFPRSLLSS